MLNIYSYRQCIAVKWLRETGEYRPAVEVLESTANLTPEFRRELARWIRRGCKRKRGATVHPDPWKELPPSLAASMLHETPVQQRVFFICITWPLMHMVATAYDPRRARAAMVAHIAESQKVNKRTAQKWVARFEAWAAE